MCTCKLISPYRARNKLYQRQSKPFKILHPRLLRRAILKTSILLIPIPPLSMGNNVLPNHPMNFSPLLRPSPQKITLNLRNFFQNFTGILKNNMVKIEREHKTNLRRVILPPRFRCQFFNAKSNLFYLSKSEFQVETLLGLKPIEIPRKINSFPSPLQKRKDVATSMKFLLILIPINLVCETLCQAQK